MERRISEEAVTKSILNWLEDNGWRIICFDFPQSGTGRVLHAEGRASDQKNKNSVIPDIIALKKDVTVFFENKDRFVFTDFKKIHDLRIGQQLEGSIRKLMSPASFKKIYYGIGLPRNERDNPKVIEAKNMVDFIVCSDGDAQVEVFFQNDAIF